MMQIPDAAIGAVIAATITALISLLGLIISKEVKVSEFRQKWTDDLRSELAELVSHILFIALRYDTKKTGETDSDVFLELKSEYLAINKVVTQIRLRLNPDEPANESILSAIQDSEELISSPGLDLEALDDVEKRLVTAAQASLKKEWRRIKSGEPIYRIARLMLIAVLGAGVLAVLATLVIQWHVF
jgi:hypothetical protein